MALSYETSNSKFQTTEERWENIVESFLNVFKAQTQAAMFFQHRANDTLDNTITITAVATDQRENYNNSGNDC